MVDYSKKENWTKGLLAFTLEQYTELSEEEKESFDRLWVAKLDCEKVTGVIIQPGQKERIYEKHGKEYHYVAVESNYIEPHDGNGKPDAVSIFMGILDSNEIDILITVPTEEARRFAQAILSVCDEIEGKPSIIHKERVLR